MKHLLFIIITFMFIGTAYSQETVTTVSATEILTKGKVIEGATYETWKRDSRDEMRSHHSMAVLYKKEIYFCIVYSTEMSCERPRDVGVITD